MPDDFGLNLSAFLREVDTTGLDVSYKHVRAVGALVKRRAVALAMAELRHNRPGDLERHGVLYANSFSVRTTRSRRSVEVILTSSHPAARALEVGQGAHEIAPRDPETRLTWPGSRDYKKGKGFQGNRGEPVQHPGAEGHHILARAMRGSAQKQRGVVRNG